MNKSLSRLTNYLAGSVLLLFSEGLYDLAFALYAYQISGKASVGAITYGLGYLSEIIVSLFGGGYLDRFGKFRIYFFTISLKVIAFSFLVYWGRHNGMSEIAVWIFAFVIDAIHHYSKLNNMMAIADLFDFADLAKAHGLLAAVQGSSRIVGPILGAALVGWFGAINALGFCAIFQTLALVFFYFSFRSSVQTKTTASRNDGHLGALRALREVMSSTFWRRYLLLDALTTLLSGTSILLVVPLLKRLFNTPDQEMGIFFAFGAAGSIAGGLLLAQGLKRLSFARRAAVSSLTQGCFLILLLGSPNLIIAAVIKFFLDFATTNYFRNAAIFIQTQAPLEQRGAYYSASDAVSRMFGLVGVVSAGFLFDTFGPTMVYSVIAIALGIVGTQWWGFQNIKTRGP